MSKELPEVEISERSMFGLYTDAISGLLDSKNEMLAQIDTNNSKMVALIKELFKYKDDHQHQIESIEQRYDNRITDIENTLNKLMAESQTPDEHNSKDSEAEMTICYLKAKGIMTDDASLFNIVVTLVDNLNRLQRERDRPSSLSFPV